MMETSNPRLYRKKMPVFWWIRKWSHLKFILRELTSLAVALFGIELILLVRAISISQESYYSYIESMGNPLMLIGNLILLGGLIFHSISWFDLAPKAMVIKIGKNTIPGYIISGSNYLGWISISIGLIWILNSNS